VLFGGIQTAAPLGPRLRAWAGRRGIGDASVVPVLADGAEWIGKQARLQLPGAPGLLDISHAREPSGGCARTVLGEGTAAATAWAEPARQALWRGGHEAVQQSLAPARRRGRSAPQRQALDGLAGYRRGQEGHRDYAGRLARG
jgi:hypothetical protein